MKRRDQYAYYVGRQTLRRANTGDDNEWEIERKKKANPEMDGLETQ